MASSATHILNNTTRTNDGVTSSFFPQSRSSASPLSAAFLTSTPAPSLNVLLRRRRSLYHPPTLKKRKHCDNDNYNTTPAFATTQASSSSFIPIQTDLPYLDFGGDEDDDEADANANTKKNQTPSCRSRNSLASPPLPRITLKKRTTNKHCFSSSSPQNLYFEDHEEEEVVREQAPQEEEEEEEEEETSTQAQQDADQEDCGLELELELEEPASCRRRTCSAPSSFTKMTANDAIVEHVPFTPISSSSSSTTTTATNSNSTNNSIRSMTRSVSLQFNLSLMNLSTATTTSSSSSQHQQQCSAAATAPAPALLKRNSLLQLTKSISTMSSVEMLSGSSSNSSARSSPVTTTFDYLATAALRFPDVAIGLSL